jgi:hypothetical protein
MPMGGGSSPENPPANDRQLIREFHMIRITNPYAATG